MFADLFALVANEIDITLFKGGGKRSAREKVPTFLPRNGRFLKFFPIHHLVGKTPIRVECMTFALALLPYLRAGRFDVVHCIDPPLARILYKLRRLLGMKFRLLYTHGCAMPPAAYPPADHIQDVAGVTYDEAVKFGIRPEAMTLLPVGIHPDRFDSAKSKSDLRREYGVPPDAFVILAVAALNRGHKRTDYLIDEVARLGPNCLLWLDGSMDQGEPDLIAYARSRLGDRCRISQVASDRVGDLYHMADILAHAALSEAFGLSMVEAASTGLPVLCHDAPHFRWLLRNPQAWVNMATTGALADRLSTLIADPHLLSEVQSREQTRRRFSWNKLRHEYLAMYERVSALPQAARDGESVNFFGQLHG